jgi:hypothetical protein
MFSVDSLLNNFTLMSSLCETQLHGVVVNKLCKDGIRVGSALVTITMYARNGEVMDAQAVQVVLEI